MKIGILTFHRCINHRPYWQARCLVDGLRRLGHEVALLDYRSAEATRAEWRCALQPLLPVRSPRSDLRLYAAKARKFKTALGARPLSRSFPLDQPERIDGYDLVIVGSDEVWNLSDPWYGGRPIFYGDGGEGSARHARCHRPDPCWRISGGTRCRAARNAGPTAAHVG